jgi:hypothetical protein
LMIFLRIIHRRHRGIIKIKMMIVFNHQLNIEHKKTYQSYE